MTQHQLGYAIGEDAKFDSFKKHVSTKLPVAFRLNKSAMNFKAIEQKFNDAEYIKKNFFDVEIKEEEGGKKLQEKHAVDFSTLALKKISWYPDGLAFELNLTRDLIRKNPGLKRLQKLINNCSDAGYLTRQELVSMLPPLFLDIKDTDYVLDMCAAPGSKTSQMIEAQLVSNTDQPIVNIKGGVIANDADGKRAYMLTHQLQRIVATGMLVVNHDGQNLPTMKHESAQASGDRKFYFDKILADVPCSGDGAIRKIPLKWKNWSYRDGCSLHIVQTMILERAVQLAKVGGLIVYSTCSLNPIENEAVVADIVAKANAEAPGSLEIVDIHDKFPGLIAHRGQDKWWVMVEKNEMKKHKSEDSKKFKPEDLFHILDSYDAQLIEELGAPIKGNFHFIQNQCLPETAQCSETISRSRTP